MSFLGHKSFVNLSNINFCIVLLVIAQGPAEIIGTVFQSLFAMPFIGVPIFIGVFSFQNFLIPIIGYGLPICAVLLMKSGCSMRNPCQRRSRTPVRAEEYIDPDGNHIEIKRVKTSKKNIDVIYNWLSDIGLTEYHEILKAEGYETVADLKTITAVDLKELGITKQMHVKRILTKNGQGTANMRSFAEGTSQGTGTNSGAPSKLWSDAPPTYGSEGNGDQPPAYNHTINQ